MDRVGGFVGSLNLTAQFHLVVLVFVCLSLWVCAHANTGPHTDACGAQEWILGVFLSHSLPYFLSQGLSLKLLISSARLAGQWATGICLSLPHT